VKRILPDLIEKGYVSYPWIGASVYPLIPEFAEFLGLKVKRGAMVAQVVRGAPAERAGLRGARRQVLVGNSLIPVGGDVIVEMDGQKVDSADALIRMIRERRPGDRIKLKVLRGDKFIKVSLVLGERPRQR
ncbi:MAG: PDZ domain-containing protein, partial [Deltaproteobacteria bacterium]|nr:PDZ domain-containing protein [Deltaproteobacteria bacterium]